jgi:NTE family protein
MKKVGVCISGGGAKIGFAVGVLEVMEEHEIKIDLAYGVSSGSICTAALCYGELQEFKKILLAIKKRDDVLKTQWCKVILTQLTGWWKADGVFKMDTMRRKLDTLPYEDPKIKGVVGYVNLQSGVIEYKATNSVSSRKEFLNAVQASCSMPVGMQSQRIGAANCVDGGIRDVLPLKALIEDPLNVNEIHMICLSPLKMPPADKTKNILEVAERSLDLLVNEVLQNDYDYAVLLNKLLAHKEHLSSDLRGWLDDKRNIRLFRYLPKESICETTDFCTENIRKGIAHGREIASKVLEGYLPIP